MHIKAQSRTSLSVHKDIAAIVDVWGCSFKRQVGVPLDERRVQAVERLRSRLREGRTIMLRFLASFLHNNTTQQRQ